LIVVASATSQVVVGRTVLRAVKVPAGAARSVAVSCPAGYFAVSAGPSRAGAGIRELEARPLSSRKFAFRLANASDVEQRVTVAAACRRVRAVGSNTSYLKLAAKRRVTLKVAPSGQRQARFTCPSGTVPAAAVGAVYNVGGNASIMVMSESRTTKTPDGWTITFSLQSYGVIDSGLAVGTLDF